MRLYEFSNLQSTIISEITDGDVNSLQVKLVGIITQLHGRIVDTGTHKPYSLTALLNLLKENGINLSPSQFREMTQSPPLSNLIANVKGNDVIFMGQNDVESSEVEAPDASTDTLDRMAKRAADKRD